MTAGPSPITLIISDKTLRAALTRALTEAGMAEGGGPRSATLIVEATGGLAGLSADVASAVEALRVKGGGSVVFVASPVGAGWDALQGLTRSYAAALAPGVRVNAIAPARAGWSIDAHQASAALIYLLQADAVTGQTIFVGAGA